MEEFAWAVQKSWGIMVASNDDHVAAAGICSTGKEIIVHFQPLVGWCLAVKDISCYNEDFHLLFFDTVYQPVKKVRVLLMPLPAIQLRQSEVWSIFIAAENLRFYESVILWEWQ